MVGKTSVLKYQQQWAREIEKDTNHESYLSTIEANLFKSVLTETARKEFGRANGSELVGKNFPTKIKALYSSSALAYNVFEY